uniref:Uncharacterized protein n=1 Tax=Helianthus annuus TaxID=4232 RepID=A0A251UR89_HELAN
MQHVYTSINHPNLTLKLFFSLNTLSFLLPLTLKVISSGTGLIFRQSFRQSDPLFHLEISRRLLFQYCDHLLKVLKMLGMLCFGESSAMPRCFRHRLGCDKPPLLLKAQGYGSVFVFVGR